MSCGISLCQRPIAQHDNTQDHQNHAGGTIQGLRSSLVGNNSGDPGPQEGEHHAENEYRPVRCAADGEMGDGAGEGRKGHNEHVANTLPLAFN